MNRRTRRIAAVLLAAGMAFPGAASACGHYPEEVGTEELVLSGYREPGVGVPGWSGDYLCPICGDICIPGEALPAKQPPPEHPASGDPKEEEQAKPREQAGEKEAVRPAENPAEAEKPAAEEPPRTESTESGKQAKAEQPAAEAPGAEEPGQAKGRGSGKQTEPEPSAAEAPGAEEPGQAKGRGSGKQTKPEPPAAQAPGAGESTLPEVPPESGPREEIPAVAPETTPEPAGSGTPALKAKESTGGARQVPREAPLPEGRFSRRFPYRRVRLKPAKGIWAEAAGDLIWGPAGSPFQAMFGD